MIEPTDVIGKYRDFLRRSIRAHGNEVKMQRQYLEASAPGKWWEVFFSSDTNNRVLKRAKRLNLDCNSDIHTYADLIASPLSQSPWMIKLDEPNAGLQNVIDKYEAYLFTKETEIMAFTRGVLVGKGWVNLRLEDSVPKLEFIKNQTSVYQDPDSNLPDNSDANECVVLNHVPASRYPGISRLEIDNTDNWATTGEDGSGTISDAYYYVKENDVVTCYHIIGAELQESYNLPFKRIPIFCFAGYNDYSSTKGGIYSGIMQKTWDIQLLRNLAMSQVASRMDRAVKAKVIASDKSIKGLEGALTKALNDETAAIVYREGTTAPSILNDVQNFTDVDQVNTYCQSKMDAIIGVTLASQLPTERTATEALLRADKCESSVSTLYSHANMCQHSIAKCIMEAVIGEVVGYSLVNGPESVSANYRKRKDIAALTEFYQADETMKSYLGYQVALTTGDVNLANGMRMNLPASVKLPDESILDAIREGAEATQVAEELSERNAEMEAQLNEANASVQSLQITLESNKDSFNLQIAQMKLDAQQKALDYQAKIAELEAKIRSMEMGNAKTVAETKKINAEAEGQEIENAKASMPDEVVVVEGV